MLSKLNVPLVLILGASALLVGTVLYRRSLGPLFYADDWATLSDAIDSSNDIDDAQIEGLMDRVGDAKFLDDLGVCYVIGDSLWIDGKNASDTGVLYTFQVPNDGHETVQVVGVKTSCGCAKAEILPDRIAPGEQAALTLSISHEKLSDGPHNYWAVVRTDTGKFWRYGVKVDIVRAAAWAQGDIYLGDVSAASTEEASTELRLSQPRFLSDIEFQAIEVTSDLVKATVGATMSTTEANGVTEHRIPVKLLLDSQRAPREGQGLCYVVGKYMFEGQEYEAISRLHWEKASRYNVAPTRVILRSSNPLEDPVEIAVSHATKVPFRISSVELPDFLELASGSESGRVPAKEQALSLTVLRDRLPSEHFFTDILLETDIDGDTTVTIPLAFLHVME